MHKYKYHTYSKKYYFEKLKLKLNFFLFEIAIFLPNCSLRKILTTNRCFDIDFNSKKNKKGKSIIFRDKFEN